MQTQKTLKRKMALNVKINPLTEVQEKLFEASFNE